MDSNTGQSLQDSIYRTANKLRKSPAYGSHSSNIKQLNLVLICCKRVFTYDLVIEGTGTYCNLHRTGTRTHTPAVLISGE